MTFLRDVARIARAEWKLFAIFSVLWLVALAAQHCDAFDAHRASNDRAPRVLPSSAAGMAR